MRRRRTAAAKPVGSKLVSMDAPLRGHVMETDMQRTPTSAKPADGPAQHFREQPNDDGIGAEPSDSTLLQFNGLMNVSPDDDFSGDPYNRTGRFRRAIR